jgi:A/G-specific adenine glycosylase
VVSDKTAGARRPGPDADRRRRGQPPPGRRDPRLPVTGTCQGLPDDVVLGWFARNARDLPWRSPDRTPWGVLVSEVMLQQTPVARVLPVWREWMRRWPEPLALAAVPVAEAIRAWGRLGYPRRALRLHGAACAIVERHGGRVPSDPEELRTLPGIGTYTAAAVASFAFGRRQAVVDVNVRRVLARAVTGAAEPAVCLNVAEMRLAERLLPQQPDRAVAWSAAVMEIGALVCTAKSPLCGQCPLNERCAWLAAGSPPSRTPVRRTQPWLGTDRRIRGMIMAELRAGPDPVNARELRRAIPDTMLRDPGQRDRALAGLVEDGLVEPLSGDCFALPQ